MCMHVLLSDLLNHMEFHIAYELSIYVIDMLWHIMLMTLLMALSNQ